VTAWSEPRRRRPSARAGVAEAPPAERARPPPVERADAVRVEPAAPLPAERPVGRPCLACCAAAGRSTQAGVRVDSCHAAAGRASVSSLLRHRRPSARAGVRVEPAVPPPAESAGERPLRASRAADDRVCGRGSASILPHRRWPSTRESASRLLPPLSSPCSCCCWPRGTVPKWLETREPQWMEAWAAPSMEDERVSSMEEEATHQPWNRRGQRKVMTCWTHLQVR